LAHVCELFSSPSAHGAGVDVQFGLVVHRWTLLWQSQSITAPDMDVPPADAVEKPTVEGTSTVCVDTQR
jgi:hypothetical protein